MHPAIYILGPPRSGTTLTAKILNNHSKIFVPGETHFFEDLYLRREEIGKVNDLIAANKILKKLKNHYSRYNEQVDQKRIDHLFSLEENIKSLTAPWKNYRDVFTSFMELQMQYEGKSRWGYHVPQDIFNYKDIKKFFPDAKIIICVRDPRDFLLSYKKKWRITLPENTERLKKLYHPILTSLLWKSSINLIPILKNHFSSENVTTIYYEDLVTYPENTVKKLCQFIGENYEPSMLEVDNPNTSHGMQQKGIFSSSIGRWKKGLSPEEVYISQIVLKKELKKHGYVIESNSLNHLKLIVTIMTFPYVLVRGINSRNELRGPLLTYLARRTLSFILKKQ